MHRRAQSSFIPGAQKSPESGTISPSKLPPLSLGMRCEVQGTIGTIRFVGSGSFSTGKWVGIELDEAKGKNNGSVQGVSYFECKDQYGVFVRPSQVKLLSPPPTSNQNIPSRTRSRPVSTIGAPSKVKHSRASSTNLKETSTLRRGSDHARATSLSIDPSNITPPEISVVASPESTIDPNSSNIVSQPINEEPENLNPTPEEMSSPQEQQLEFAPKTPIDKFHPPIPYRQYEELRIKLKILDAKRSEDRERWKQFEQSRAETEQFLALKTKLTAKLTEMQAELRETRSTINNITREKEDMELKSLEVSETLEMVALDKEMAEEKADNLAHELDALKERLAEVTTSLQVYQNPSTSFIGSPDQSFLPQHSAELEKQNERLKDALVRLRDISAETETKLQRKIKELEREVLAIADLRHHHDKVKEQLELSQNQVELLKERLDDALASEELVEQLTEKNLNLGEKIEEMEVVIEDLEALKELNDELEETHLEAAKQLQEEIDLKDAQIRELVRRFDSQQESIADYENTIVQFRNLVSTLQADLQHLRDQQANQAIHTETLSSQSQAMMNLNLHLQSSVTKAQAKAIDLELRKFDANQAIEHLSYVQPYLPSSFFKKENDSINCLLIFKRMGFKANLIGSQLVNQSLSQYQANPNSMLPILSSDYLMQLELTKFSNIMKTFTTYLSTCSVAEFSKIGQYHSQLTSQEKTLDHLIHMLQKEQFESYQLINELRPLASSFEHMAQAHLSESQRVKALEPYLSLQTVIHGLDVFETNLKIAQKHFELGNGDETNQLDIDEDNREQITANFLEPLTNLLSLHSQFRVQLKKLIKKLEPLNECQKCLKPEVANLCTPIHQEYLQLIQFSISMQAKLNEYLKEKTQASESVLFNSIQNISNICAQQDLNLNEVSPFDSATRTSNHLITLLSNFTEKLSVEDPKYLPWTDLPHAEAPWIIRSREFQKEIVVDQAMERKLDSLNEEIINLVKDVKTKDVNLQEAVLQVEHLTHRSENYKQQAELAKEQEIQLIKAKEQEESFERTLEKLYQDIEKLEEENISLKEEKSKEQLTSPSRRGTISGKSPSDPDNFGSIEHQLLNDLNGMDLIQIKTLNTRLQYLREENTRLKARHLAHVLNLDSHWITTMLQGQERSYLDKLQVKESIDELSVTAQYLIKDVERTIACPRVVNLTEWTDTPKKWKSQSKHPRQQFLSQQALMNTYKRRGELLHEQFLGVMSKLAI